MQARSDKARDVRHVHHEQRAYLLGDCGNRVKINDARISARARDDHLGRGFQRGLAQRLVIDPFIPFGYAV